MTVVRLKITSLVWQALRHLQALFHNTIRTSLPQSSNVPPGVCIESLNLHNVISPIYFGHDSRPACTIESHYTLEKLTTQPKSTSILRSMWNQLRFKVISCYRPPLIVLLYSHLIYIPFSSSNSDDIGWDDCIISIFYSFRVCNVVYTRVQHHYRWTSSFRTPCAIIFFLHAVLRLFLSDDDSSIQTFIVNYQCQRKPPPQLWELFHWI